MSPAGWKALKRISDLRFYVECLTNDQRKILAARYLRKTPPRHRNQLLQVPIDQLAFCEVFSWETYGW